MQAFTYHVPTKVIFGRDTESQSGQAVRAAGGTTVLVLYGGGSAVKSGLVDRVTASLEADGLTWYVKGGIQPNPVLHFVNETLAEYADKGIDFILAVGGGSVLDTAKALGVGFPRPKTPVWDYFSGKEIPLTAVPVGAVLTIAAAGSETSDSTVITNQATGEKRGFNSQLHRPSFAIMNPELTYTLPPYQTACGVADIMMHTMDRYFSDVDGNELTDAMAEAILRTVIQFGQAALEDPADYQARSEVMWCGSLSHNNLTGLGRTKDFTVHQLGHELSGGYGIAHGASLTIMWPAWAKKVWGKDPARFARLGRTVFGVTELEDEKAAVVTISAVETVFQSMGLPTSLGRSEIGVLSAEALEAVALGCSRNKSRSVGAFYPLDRDGLLEVYRTANL